MRTTLDIDDDLLHAAKDLARREGASAGAVVSRLLRQSLTGVDRSATTSAQAGVAGFSPFAGKPGVVTSLAEVNALREAEGI